MNKRRVSKVDLATDLPAIDPASFIIFNASLHPTNGYGGGDDETWIKLMIPRSDKEAFHHVIDLGGKVLEVSIRER